MSRGPTRAPISRPDQVDRWLARLGIAELKDKYPGQISGGQRQRTAIARSLLQQPGLLLMDEPFSSLDALTREDLQRLTVELRGETGLTTVIVTHIIEEAVYLGQKILVLGQPPNTRRTSSRTRRPASRTIAGSRRIGRSAASCARPW